MKTETSSCVNGRILETSSKDFAGTIKSISAISLLSNSKEIIDNVKPSSRNPYEFEQLDYLEDDERWLTISEGRPCPMNWYVLLPKITKNVTL